MAVSIKPIIGLPSDVFWKDDQMYHSIGDKYLRAVHDVAHCVPVMIPSMGDVHDLDATLDRLDGIVMTGALSNVHPPHYGHDPSEHHEPYDHHRDATTLKMISKVLDRGMPLLCICRGYQELNVVLGGTLATEIHTAEGRLDHRAPDHEDMDVRYGPVHDISIREGGLLHSILGKTVAQVNTVHRQGIDRLAKGLVVEADAPDGVIEAVRVLGTTGFALGVQWHPEYKAAENPDSVKLFEAYGEAARAYLTGEARPAA